jgi:Nuclease subunit of the excinuclease complex
VYRYWDKAEIVYIGRGKNIKSRSKDIHRNSWVYDKIEYSLIDDEHDQNFWESKFISAFKTEFGRLPRYNEVAGASIIKLENGRTNESII